MGLRDAKYGCGPAQINHMGPTVRPADQGPVRAQAQAQTDARADARNIPAMLPSLLARDVQQGLKQCLVSGFEPADAFMHGMMSHIPKQKSAWRKRP